MPIPENLNLLHRGELELRERALEVIAAKDFGPHLELVTSAMNLADALRQFSTEDEDMKAVQALGIRIFNGFAASVTLGLYGYSQNSALVMSSVPETAFLLEQNGSTARLGPEAMAGLDTVEKGHFATPYNRELNCQDGRFDSYFTWTWDRRVAQGDHTACIGSGFSSPRFSSGALAQRWLKPSPLISLIPSPPSNRWPAML